MMAEHTVGPWMFDSMGIFGFVDGKRELIASLNDGDFAYEQRSEDESYEELQANGRLMARSPQLLDALVALMAAAPSGDELRMILVGFGGTRVGPNLHDQCDRLTRAFELAREALDRNGT